MKLNLFKLFSDLLKLGKVETDNGTLLYEGDVLAEGTEVFIEDAEGNIIPAPDGQYGQYKVVDGKIAPNEEEKPAEEEVKVEEAEETPVEETPAEPEPESTPEEKDDKEERIKALEDAVAELKKTLDELTTKKEDEEFSAMKPAEAIIKDVQTGKGKGALKYFE